jgi:hypothetical protein
MLKITEISDGSLIVALKNASDFLVTIGYPNVIIDGVQVYRDSELSLWIVTIYYYQD